MIRVEAPLRLPLGGGGTDLPSYYIGRGGFLVTACLRDAVRVTLQPRGAAAGSAGPWIEEALRHLGPPAGIEARVESDLPPGSGLGGSGAVLVALAHALRLWRGERPAPRLLAEEAFRVERQGMGRPIGRQDAFAAAYGGVLALRIDRDGRTRVRRLRLARPHLRALERALLLVDTGVRRDAAVPLAEQERSALGGTGVVELMDAIGDLGRLSARLIEAGRPAGLGAIFRRHWELKRRLTPGTATTGAERCIALGLGAGARGGKLIGAGGGGFVLLHCGTARPAVIGALTAAGFETRPVRLAARGSHALPAESVRAA